MLSQLRIENIAVIRSADIEFEKGLNIMTGETGAGKSIVIDSLNAILGGRVSREIVRKGCDKASVTAVFEPSEQAESWLSESGIDAEDELIILRRISADGKSSARVNGVPVSAVQLRELGAMLIDIHGQNDGRALLDEARHLGFLDAYGAPEKELAGFQEAYKKWRETKKEIDALSMDELEKERLTENLKYTIAELERVDLKAGEYDEKSARRDLLHNSEKLTESLDIAYDALYGGEPAAISLCGDARSYTERASGLMPELSGAVESIMNAALLLEDAAETIRDFRAGLDFSPQEYDKLEERISTLKRLFKKYGRDEEALIAYLDECREKLDGLEYSGDRLIKLQKQLDNDEKAVEKAGEVLTVARKRAAESLQTRIEKELHELSMPSAKFVARVSPIAAKPGFNKTGSDEVQFLLAANSGSDPGRISKIASGGELSRIMLAMKAVFAESDIVGTMVFDEIDTGVSGVAAQRVGEKLGEISGEKQVLCVTHLPQIAAMADTHFLILKTDDGGETSTDVTRLDDDGRIHEIARLHGGDVVTDTTLKSAGEQILAAKQYKENRRE